MTVGMFSGYIRDTPTGWASSCPPLLDGEMPLMELNTLKIIPVGHLPPNHLLPHLCRWHTRWGVSQKGAAVALRSASCHWPVSLVLSLHPVWVSGLIANMKSTVIHASTHSACGVCKFACLCVCALSLLCLFFQCYSQCVSQCSFSDSANYYECCENCCAYSVHVQCPIAFEIDTLGPGLGWVVLTVMVTCDGFAIISSCA